MQQENENLAVPQILESQTTQQPQEIGIKPKKYNRKILIAIGIIFVFILVIIIVVGYFYWQKSQINEADILPTPTPITASAPEGIWPLKPNYGDTNLPDFSVMEPIPQTQVDTSNWLTYKNDQLGFEFKYPSEWGEYVQGLYICESTFCKEAETDEPIWRFDLIFGNSPTWFGISGASPNSPQGYEGLDFTSNPGLTNEELKTFCDWDLLDCKVDGDTLYARSLYPCLAGPNAGSQFELAYMFALPKGKKIGGITIDAGWITEDSPVWDWMTCDEPGLSQVKSAIEQRKFDAESVKALDIYNAVIESVRILQ